MIYVKVSDGFSRSTIIAKPRRSLGLTLCPLENAGIRGAELDDRVEALLKDVGLDVGLKNRFAGEISAASANGLLSPVL